MDADIMGCREEAIQVIRSALRQTRDWITSLMVLGLVTTASYTYWAPTYGPPVVFDRVETLNDPVPQGKWLSVRIHRAKNRECPVLSRRWATNGEGRVFNIPDAFWHGGAAGAEPLNIEYDTSELPVGGYTLTVQLTYGCVDNKYTMYQPPASFAVR